MVLEFLHPGRWLNVNPFKLIHVIYVETSVHNKHNPMIKTNTRIFLGIF
jgi:hypothetical protein